MEKYFLISVVSYFEIFSVRPLCPLCLCGESLLAIAHHKGRGHKGGTEKTETTYQPFE